MVLFKIHLKTRWFKELQQDTSKLKAVKREGRERQNRTYLHIPVRLVRKVLYTLHLRIVQQVFHDL